MKRKLILISRTFIMFFCLFNVINLKAQVQDATIEAALPSDLKKVDKDKPFNMLANFSYMKLGTGDYMGFRIQPELSFLKFGVGLDIPLMVNLSNGQLYNDEFKGGVGVLRLISYARYGVKKVDPVFIRVGVLNDTYLGYGLLVNNYTNTISFDQKKFGLSFDILVKNFIGVEGLYSDFNFASVNLLGVRPYIKPFGMTKIPVLKNMDIGISYVTDHDNTYKPVSVNDFVRNQYSKSGIQAGAIDIGIPLINRRIINLRVFGQYGMLFKLKSDSLLNLYKYEPDSAKKALEKGYKDGTGGSVGAEMRINFGSLLSANLRLERLMYSDYFIPQFFDISYEINKDAKISSLLYTTKTQGIFGSLSANLIGKIYAKGSLLMPDNMGKDSPGLLKIDLDASGLTKFLSITGTYTKSNITSLDKQIFVLDNYSIIQLTIAYKIYPWLLVGVIYERTYSETSDGKFLPVEVYSPYIGINLKF